MAGCSAMGWPCPHDCSHVALWRPVGPQSLSSCPAGSTKLVVQAVEVRDVLGRFGKASGLDAGVILSTWNPDAGWEKDALVSYWRGSAILLDVLCLKSLQQAAADLLEQACQDPFCHEGIIHKGHGRALQS